MKDFEIMLGNTKGHGGCSDAKFLDATSAYKTYPKERNI
jgi:hypothetical protein